MKASISIDSDAKPTLKVVAENDVEALALKTWVHQYSKYNKEQSDAFLLVDMNVLGKNFILYNEPDDDLPECKECGTLLHFFLDNSFRCMNESCKKYNEIVKTKG
jgi:hypothetical protein